MGEDERGEVLVGGNANRGMVVRIGETVRRPQHRRSAATHALLQHLERVGFEGAPRFLGTDEQGREVLTFLHGDVPTAPYPAYALTPQALASVAQLLRDYHEALAGFDPAAHRWPRPAPPAYRDGTTISHNDVKPENVLFRGGRAVALLDFDLAAPGSRLWDVAMAARLWVPLRDDADIDDERHGRTLERLRGFVDSYGLQPADQARLLGAITATLPWGYEPVQQGARSGHPGFAQYWQEAAGRARRTQSWCTSSLADLLHRALQSDQ